MAKSINLTVRDKPKSKKQDKYAETNYSTKNEYTHNVDGTAFYLGLLEEYKGKECVIVKRSRRKQNEYYRVKFEDGEETDTSIGFLKTSEEYEQWLLDQEDEDSEDNTSDMSEFELELNKQGIASYGNYVTCLSPIELYERRCGDECGYRLRCVYRNKGNYKKFKFN